MKKQEKRVFDIAVIGDGLAGFLLLYELSKYPAFARQKVLLLGDGKEKHRTWCFWDKGLEPQFRKMVHTFWKELSFKSDSVKISKDLNELTYYYIPGSSFFQYFLEEFLPKHNHIIYRTDKALEIKGSQANFEITAEHEVYGAKNLYNSAFLGNKPQIDLWQHFRGWFVESEEAVFETKKALLMDFSIAQKGDCRFMYVLPLSEKRALIELTYFSPQPLKISEYDIDIARYISERFGDKYMVLEKEYGQIPMQQGVFQHSGKNGEINLGTYAGMVKASTGYAFQRILKDSKELAHSYFSGERPRRFTEKDRFAFYDSLLLWVIRNHPHACSRIFSCLFQRREIDLIFRFMDQQTNLWEELKIFSSLPAGIFLKALFYKMAEKVYQKPNYNHKDSKKFQNV